MADREKPQVRIFILSSLNREWKEIDEVELAINIEQNKLNDGDLIVATASKNVRVVREKKSTTLSAAQPPIRRH